MIAASDLVHLHSNGFIVEVGAWLARRFGKPYVMTLYGTDVSAHDPSRNRRYGNVVRHAASRVFYSRGLLEHASRLGLSPNPSQVIYAPVSADFRRVDERARTSIRESLGAGDSPVLLSVKHLRPVCGHETLLKSMPEVLKRYPRASLWLVGEGELRASLEATCRELGIAGNVRFLGRIPNDEVWKYYTAADVFVLASDVESWGTVMLESIACGTPVVTTDTIGGLEVRDNFPDDVTVVRRGDSRQLSVAIAKALDAPRRTSPSSSARLQSEFSVDACASRYLEVYRQALTASR